MENMKFLCYGEYEVASVEIPMQMGGCPVHNLIGSANQRGNQRATLRFGSSWQRLGVDTK